MIQAKTYTVGRDGSVLRLDDLTGSWIDVSCDSVYSVSCFKDEVPMVVVVP